jgi:hypothetical protein
MILPHFTEVRGKDVEKEGLAALTGIETVSRGRARHIFCQVIQSYRVARCGDELIAGFERSLSNAPS